MLEDKLVSVAQKAIASFFQSASMWSGVSPSSIKLRLITI